MKKEEVDKLHKKIAKLKKKLRMISMAVAEESSEDEAKAPAGARGDAAAYTFDHISCGGAAAAKNNLGDDLGDSRLTTRMTTASSHFEFNQESSLHVHVKQSHTTA